MYLEKYFEAVHAYNTAPTSMGGVERWQKVQVVRTQVGNSLDAADREIPTELRWKYRDGTDYNFGRLCAMRPHLAEQLTGEAEFGETKET